MHVSVILILFLLESAALNSRDTYLNGTLKFFIAGFFRQPMERPLTNSVSFQHPVHSSLAPRASIPGDGLANDIVRFMLEKNALTIKRLCF